MAKRIIKGGAALRRKLRAAGSLGVVSLAASLREEGGRIMADAKKRTPVDLDVLRPSGDVLPPQISGTKVRIVMGFGGAASKYAIRQHEELGYKHTVGEAKFLENAFLAREKMIPPRVAAGLAAHFQRLRGE